MDNLIKAVKSTLKESFMPDDEFVALAEAYLLDVKNKKMTVEDFIDAIYDEYYGSEEVETQDKEYDWTKSLTTPKKETPSKEVIGKPGQMFDAT